jgi:hypothetical protein
MTTTMAEDVHTDSRTAEQRWNVWVARGVAQDRQIKTRALIGFPVVAALVILALLLLR